MREKLNRLQLCVTIVLILEILTGIILICMTGHYHRSLAGYLAKSERQTLISQLSNIYLLGFELLVCYSVGLCLWRFVSKSEAIMEHSKLLAAWNVFCLLIVICGSIEVWFLYNSVQSLQDATATSLFQGMDLYFSDPEWKLLWDGIQYHNECCGVNGYEDWKEAFWMPEEQSKCQSSSSSNIVILIPYACCKRSATACFQNYAPQLTAITAPYLNSNDINTNGCLPKFNYLTCELFYNVAIIMLIVFILQIIVLILELATISKVKKLLLGSRDCSEDNDERPLVVVKYPRNVRCITLTDEENFDEADQDEEEDRYRHKRSSPLTEGISVRQEIINDKRNIFLH